MKIHIPVAAYHEYNTAVYVERAFRQLGHEARIITQGEFYEDYPDVDLFFGVDSAGPLDFPDKHLSKTAMWFIDSRRNRDPAVRTPDDDTNAKKIEGGGGWNFQANVEARDHLIHAVKLQRVSWLPVAADPETWKPYDVDIQFDVGFGGNVWCGTRGELLARIGRRFKLGTFTGRPEVLARGYSQSRVGFNISSFYGTEFELSVNMRPFEVMSCGIPLITNALQELQWLGIISEHSCLTYDDLSQAMGAIEYALSKGEGWRREMGQRARLLILEGHTYQHRMQEVLEILEAAGGPSS